MDKLRASTQSGHTAVCTSTVTLVRCCTRALLILTKSDIYTATTSSSTAMKLVVIVTSLIALRSAVAFPLGNTTMSRRAGCRPQIDDVTQLFRLTEGGGECADTKASVSVTKQGPEPIDGISLKNFGGPCTQDLLNKIGCSSDAIKMDSSGTPSAIYKCIDVKNVGPTWVKQLDSCNFLTVGTGSNARLRRRDATLVAMCAGVNDQQDQWCCGTWKGGNNRAECPK